MSKMWGEEEFPYATRVGDYVEWEDGRKRSTGKVVDVLRSYGGAKAYQLLVKNSDGYHEVELGDVYFWEPYGEDKQLDDWEIMQLDLYAFVRRWDLWREQVDEMLDFIYQK